MFILQQNTVALYIFMFLIISFLPAHAICNQQFCFERDTFIFFNQNIRKENYARFKLAEQKLFGIVSLGTLNNEELKRIIKCALKSDFIPKETEEELKVFKDTL